MSELETKSMTDLQLRNLRRQRTKEMRLQLTGFSFMIFLTFMAFAMVALDFNATFIMGAVMLFAFIQVIMQFYYFMHMKDKGHEFPALLIFGGIWVTFLVGVTFVTIIWW